MARQQETYGERIHMGEIIGYLPSARRAEFKTDAGEVILCDVDLSSGDCNLTAHIKRPRTTCVIRYGPSSPVMVEFHPAGGA